MAANKKEMIKDSKYILIVYLLEQKKCSMQDIVKMTPTEATEYFDASMDDKTAEYVKLYVNKNLDAIKKSNYFFPGKDGGTSKVGSILSGLRLYLIKNGRSLGELGLSSKRAPTVGIPEAIEDSDGIAKALKDLFIKKK